MTQREKLQPGKPSKGGKNKKDPARIKKQSEVMLHPDQGLGGAGKARRGTRAGQEGEGSGRTEEPSGPMQESTEPRPESCCLLCFPPSAWPDGV